MKGFSFSKRRSVLFIGERNVVASCLGCCPRLVLGTLSDYDDDGSGNIAKKWICVLSNFIAFIWNRSIRQMQATLPGVECLMALSMFKQRKEKSTSSIKSRIGRLHVVVVQWTSKKCTKKRDACAEGHKTNCFLTFLLSSSSYTCSCFRSLTDVKLQNNSEHLSINLKGGRSGNSLIQVLSNSKTTYLS